MPSKVCHYPGCSVAIDGVHLLCVTHWHKLPARIQAGIQERIRGWHDRAAAEEFLNSWFFLRK